MSEKSNKKPESSLWALSFSGRPDDPLKLALERLAALNPTRYIREDNSIRKMPLLHDLVVIALRKLGMERGDQEALRLLDEHERREQAKAALHTGAPLPAAPTSVSSISTAPPPPTPLSPLNPTPLPTPASTPPVKKRREIEFFIDESGHAKYKEE